MVGKIVACALIMLVAPACTTLRPIEGSPSELRQRINSGELVRVGDRLEVVTSDGKTHQITVSKVGDGRIDGKEESIRIDQIVSLRKREFSGGRTLALVGGVVLVVVGAIAASHPAPHFTP
jgi:hypothetical protein